MHLYSSEIKNYWEQFACKWVKYRKRRAYYWNSISKYCNYFIHPESSVLEVGCGGGDLLNAINAKEKTGVDFSPAMIKIAKEQFPGIRFHEMAAEELNLDDKYDVVVMSNLIGLLPDIEQVF